MKAGWEYKSVLVPHANFVKKLNEYGQENWEVVAVNWTTFAPLGETSVLLKRRYFSKVD